MDMVEGVGVKKVTEIQRLIDETHDNGGNPKYMYVSPSTYHEILRELAEDTGIEIGRISPYSLRIYFGMEVIPDLLCPPHTVHLSDKALRGCDSDEA